MLLQLLFLGFQPCVQECISCSTVGRFSFPRFWDFKILCFVAQCAVCRAFLLFVAVVAHVPRCASVRHKVE